MQKEKVLSILLLLLVSCFCVFSYEITNTSEAVLLFYPRKVTYDQGSAIELKTAKTTTISDIKSENYPSLGDFSPESPVLALFRLYDTLDNMNPQVPDYNQLSATHLSYHGNDVVVTIHTTGLFVNVDDASITRDFSLTAFCTRAKIDSNGNEYAPESEEDIMQLGANTDPYFRRNGSDYTLYVPDSQPIKISKNGQYRIYPYYLYLFDICISLDQTVSTLPSGLYQTVITVTSTSYRNNYIKEWNSNQQKPIVQETSAPLTLSQTFTVYGYVSDDGVNPNKPNSQEYSFIIRPSTDTYSMDLAPTAIDGNGHKTYSDYYAVANLNFSAIASDVSSRTENPGTKYTIYISPNEPYTTAGTDFIFTKNGDLSTAIHYDLFVKTGSGYASFNNGFTYGVNTNQQTTIIGTGGKNGYGYYLLPDYRYVTNTHNGNTKYNESWTISDLMIYLKVKDEDGTIVNYSLDGDFRSSLYFTVVVQ